MLSNVIMKIGKGCGLSIRGILSPLRLPISPPGLVRGIVPPCPVIENQNPKIEIWRLPADTLVLLPKVSEKIVHWPLCVRYCPQAYMDNHQWPKVSLAGSD